MSKEIETKLNPSVSTQPNQLASPKMPPASGGIKRVFLFAYVLTIGIGNFQFGKHMTISKYKPFVIN